jgi:hypothetical protein
VHSNLEKYYISNIRTMDTFPPDLGKIVLPGFANADPPGQAQFAFTTGDTGFATTISNAGSEVSIDNLGGINMIASSAAFVGIDSFANITLDTGLTSGVMLLKTNGLGNDVDIENAGTIAFDSLGAGALTGVQTINGSVYPPAAPSVPVYTGLSVIPGDGTSTEWFINVTSEVPNLTTTSVVQVTLQVPDGSSQNWIVSADPLAPAGVNRYIRIVFASPVTDTNTTVAWFVAALEVVPSEASTIGP